MSEPKTIIEKMAWNMAVSDPEQHGQINDSELGFYMWEKYRDYYIALAETAAQTLRSLPEAVFGGKPVLPEGNQGSDESEGRLQVDPEQAQKIWQSVLSAILEEHRKPCGSPASRLRD